MGSRHGRFRINSEPGLGPVRGCLPSLRGRDGGHDQGGDPVGPPPSQGVIEHEGRQGEQASGRACAAENAVTLEARLLIRRPSRCLAYARGVRITSETLAAASVTIETPRL